MGRGISGCSLGAGVVRVSAIIGGGIVAGTLRIVIIGSQ